MDIRSAISSSISADANKRRDWRVFYADLALALIHIARKLYLGEDFGVDLDNTVYALDASTIDLCQSILPLSTYPPSLGSGEASFLAGSARGNIPTFIHISDGKLHDVNALDLLIPKPGALYIMDRRYLDFTRLYRFGLDCAFLIIHATAASSFSTFRQSLSTRTVDSDTVRRSCSPTTIRYSTTLKSYGASNTTMPPPRRPWPS